MSNYHRRRASGDDTVEIKVTRHRLAYTWAVTVETDHRKAFGAVFSRTYEKASGKALTKRAAFERVHEALANAYAARPIEHAVDEALAKTEAVKTVKTPPPPPPPPAKRVEVVNVEADTIKNGSGAAKAQNPERVTERPAAEAMFVKREPAPVDSIASILPEALAKPGTIKKGEKPPASWLKVPDAAKAYGVAQATIYNRIHAGKLQHGKFGGTTYVEAPVEADS